jgi:hypothetical protein
VEGGKQGTSAECTLQAGAFRRKRGGGGSKHERGQVVVVVAVMMEMVMMTGLSCACAFTSRQGGEESLRCHARDNAVVGAGAHHAVRLPRAWIRMEKRSMGVERGGMRCDRPLTARGGGADVRTPAELVSYGLHTPMQSRLHTPMRAAHTHYKTQTVRTKRTHSAHW